MKTEKLCCLFFASICMSFFSCEKKGGIEQKELITNNNYVNHWIYDEMSIWYLWNDYLPAKPDYNLNPKDFFNSICYKYDKNTNPEGDRFSFILENYVELMNLLSGVSSDEMGFEFMLYYADEKKKNVIGEIQYVKKNTPAQLAGLKRGQFFSKINGIQLNVSNYYDLLSPEGNYTITLHDAYIDNVNGKNAIVFANSTEKSLSTVPNYADNPVFLDTVYTINNKNIAYLVYNFFAGDANDGGSHQYDIDLANIFSKFSQKNIDNMIIDLRYNSGGAVQSSIYLASMLGKGISSKEVFLRAEYNSLVTEEIMLQFGSDFFYSYFADEIALNSSKYPLPNIGNILQNLIFLTGQNTASASEMVINGLKPYMDITLLGDTTVGKNVGSILIYDEKNPKKNKWGILPIIVKLYNSRNQSDFTAGFIPDILDQDRYIPKYDLGDLREGLLSRAIEHITGSPAPELKSSGIKPQQASLRPIDSSISRKKWTNRIVMPKNSLLKLE